MNQRPPRQNRLVLWVLGIFVFVLLLLLVLLQSSNLWKSFSVETASDTLLLYGLSSLNVAAFVIFGFIFLRSVVKLLRERRSLQLGAKIRLRLFFYFGLVSLLPIIAMAVFSYLFMNRALERWFTQIPENVVRQAGKIQEQSNSDQFVRLQETARMLVVSFEGKEVSQAELQAIVTAGDLVFAEILDKDNRPLISVNLDQANAAEIEIVRRGEIESESLRDGIGLDVAVATFKDGRKLVIGPNPRSTASVGQVVTDSLAEMDRLKDSQATVRQIGFLTLGVLTFLLIFASSWTAFYIARGFTVPIRALAEGADKIAQGDLSHRVDVLAEDELGLLVSTFNDMSAKLEANSEELTERRRYIETILLSLPTGVISLDSQGRISTINPSARAILHLEGGDFAGVEFSKLLTDADRADVERITSRARRVGHASDQIKLSVDSGAEERPVALIATALPDESGVVLVIEDLSELIAAQRASAWQEVARRMAHEIKNPLTPIQLSAERIARRFAGHLSEQPAAVGGISPSVDDANAKIVEDGTSTILREVQSLKAMVDEFSRFARLPTARLELWDVNEVLRQTAALYSERSFEVTIDQKLSDELPSAMIDDEQLKRVFVNLIDNAIEAPRDVENCVVTMSSRLEAARDIIVVEIADNGRGIEPADYQKLFQPYFSTKGRGTGLGLAIVQRIIAEHHGKIKAVPNQPHGAKFIVEIPVATLS